MKDRKWDAKRPNGAANQAAGDTPGSKRARKASSAAGAVRAAREMLTRPNRYRCEVAAYALLGFVVLFVLTAAALALALAGTWLLANTAMQLDTIPADKALTHSALGAGLLAIAGLLAHTLTLPPRPVDGLVVQRSQAPVLFHELESLRARLNAARIHEVRLGKDFNAAIVRRPRLGALGWHHNTLVLGLPLLLTLPRSAARAVLAHELAHLSRAPDQFNGRVYRLRQRWRSLADSLVTSRAPTRRLLGRFFRWYSRRFTILTLPLAREHEFEADAAAAELTSVVHTTMALTNAHAYARCVDYDYWAPLYARLGKEAYPPQRAWTDLAHFIEQASTDRAQILAYVGWCLAGQTSAGHSHPSLADRLAALNAPDLLPSPLRRSAAADWFGRHYVSLLQRFDTHWWLEHEARWRKRFEGSKGAERVL